MHLPVLSNHTSFCHAALRRVVAWAIVCLSMLPGTAGAVGQRHLVPVAPDSSDFIKASVMRFSPLDNYESVLGHCALHMECPSEDFDLVFGLLVDYDIRTWQQLLGQFNVCVSRVHTDSILSISRKEGRQVEEWTLNLTHHEKQRLWMLLDKASAKVMPDEKFCLLNSNCSSTVIHALEQCLIGEYLDLGPRQGPLALSRYDYLQWMFRESPWYLFAVVTMGGDSFDRESPVEHAICIESLIPVLEQATLRTPDNADSLVVRPLLTGEHRELLPLVTKPSTSGITPKMVLLALFAVTLLVTLLEWVFRMRRTAMWFDRVLFALYAVWALVVLWLAVIGMTYAGARWNWYIIPFNLIPIIVWACRRRHPGYKKVFLLYAVVLTLFLLATPLVSQIDFDHQLITASLALRC